ncbi:MAG: phosphopantothenoylcysteine decarboxylase / phosphopantothenate--cysteine ligase [Puniceicoccaceae bacterium 5H]|nr:MAG: phosphopantothenoylcysteine decarboxylase / phosphopantothenate--cysteine ligase [Puniceicoccaceae bacterium 5H]
MLPGMVNLPGMNASPIRCLVSAGPTREYFDPVRFLSNPSSGKMGYAIAEAARQAGWQVDLVSGPVALADPPGVNVTRVETGQEMYDALAPLFATCDVLVMTAAIMDYRPAEKAPQKVKKDQLDMSVRMEPVMDVLKTLAQRKRPGQYIVGFAAETNDLETYARGKLLKKKCDLIVGNYIGRAGTGFQSDQNTVFLFAPNQPARQLGPASKVEIARELVRLIGEGRGTKADSGE